MDPELHFLVALSDKNMVIVWKREEASWATEEDIEVSLMFLYTDFFVLVEKTDEFTKCWYLWGQRSIEVLIDDDLISNVRVMNIYLSQ